MRKTQKNRLKKRIYELLEPAALGDTGSKYLDDFITVLIVLNIFAVTLESIPSLGDKYLWQFYIFEVISIVVFTIEYILRIWTADLKKINKEQKLHTPKRLRYLLSVNGIIDLLSIAPFYLQFIIPAIDLRILRTLRLLRILKLSTYNSALMDLFLAIISAMREAPTSPIPFAAKDRYDRLRLSERALEISPAHSALKLLPLKSK